MFQFRQRFSINAVQNAKKCRLIFFDSLSPKSAVIVEDGGQLSLDRKSGRLAAIRMLLPPSIDNHPLRVREHPLSSEDAHFWQYPAITEKLASQHHAEAFPLAWSPEFHNAVDTYLGLPWASYIDKSHIPKSVKQVFGIRMRGYCSLADEWELQWGKDVRLHTVCQHIYWKRLLPLWAELGVTDLHLSHCESESEKSALVHGIRVHSWPLVAPNVVNPERRLGLTIGKPLDQRCLLASFIGAHMSHYRSDVRLRLREEATENANGNVVFELKDDWHFNRLVYGEQVGGQKVDEAAAAIEQRSTEYYNRVLSDSVFALCPEGAGPNTLRLWEAMAVGAIPVVLVEDWIWPPVPGSGLGWSDAVIHLRRDETSGIFARLRALLASEPGRLAHMQSAGMALYKRFEKLRCFQ